ncbi:hypothetical protein [Spiroplasma endosymbiont of Polydrusus formosus]|uniref:hypothetical protein n=1 Tax=Spiroplasma endosymbiont of Polydrusus formosus TaxID=3139326 RepID=UPI0035B527F7
MLVQWGGVHSNIAYQYFFLQITNPKVAGLSVIVLFVITIILISGIIIAFGSLYHFIILKLAKYPQ